MKVVFRVDASTRIGTGHIMRCLNLAEALREQKVHTHFICRNHVGNLIPLLRREAMNVTVLPVTMAPDAIHGENYQAWLGATPVEDYEQTIEALNGEQPDCLVVDHYGLDVEWERKLRPNAGRLMVVDDLANRHHDCDLLLDQNYSVEGSHRYMGLVPLACQLLIGPRYALLHSKYSEFRKKPRVRDGRVERVLIFFGGSDPKNMTGLALDALLQIGLRNLHIDIVVGANNPYDEVLQKQSANRPQIKIHRMLPYLADLMTQADLALGAGGVTTLERMCLGLPSIVLSIADNQRPGCEALSQAGAINYVGDVESIRIEDIVNAVEQLTSNPDRLLALSTRSSGIVDGLGASRIADALVAN
jgi:UDP-2,4-diacetamido-2,4,6-trideoxy-beta-L-altropyranose hydrolase